MSSENVNVKDQVGGGGKGKHGLVARLLDQTPYPGFGALSSDWSFTLPDDVDSVSGYENIIQTLHTLIEDILERCLYESSRTDFVRFAMMQDGLDHYVSLPFMPRDEVTVDRIMEEAKRVLDSYREINLNESLRIHLIVVEDPRGRGKKRITRTFNVQHLLASKCSYVNIKNPDELCMARALVTGMAYYNRKKSKKHWNEYKYMCGGKSCQRTQALELHAKAQVPIGSCGLEEARLFEKALNLNEDTPLYCIVIYSQEHFGQVIYKGEKQATHQLTLWYSDGHYDVITNPVAFFGDSYYCTECLKSYHSKQVHRCIKTCERCKSNKCASNKEIARVVCHDCHRSFYGWECYNTHLRVTSQAKKSTVCSRYKKCLKCEKEYDLKTMFSQEHRCYTKKCMTCKSEVSYDHLCYMQNMSSHELDKNEATQYLFYDFECMQETGTHIPNLVVCQDEMGCEWSFSGPNTAKEFCDWLLVDERPPTICIAHNMQGYDGYFIMKHVLERGIKCEPIMRGSKILYMEVLQIKFIDSLNFLSMPLSAFPKTFGLSELKKGYFPHFFNTEENQDYVGPMPPMDMYGPDMMKRESRDEFVNWYHHQVTTHAVFDFRKEIMEYCRSDVDILRRCCLKFRTLFQKECGLDPFLHSFTIASACNKVYRHRFLKPNTIGIVPLGGYRVKIRQSNMAFRWLHYLEKIHQIQIEHGRSSGERNVCGYYVDGFYNNTVYEFHGCLYHGCVKCYKKRELLNPINSFSMETLYQKTLKKRKTIEEAGYGYVEMWECDWKRMKESEEVKQALQDFNLVEPICERDAFFGGRTNAVTLYKKAAEGEKMEYVDFTSLYPSVCMYAEYPIGHPQIITEHFDTVTNYFGLVKCKVYPPRELFHPVLPARVQGKLMFPLCHTCAEKEKQDRCEHDDEQRSLTGTWVSVELNKALEKGYKLVEVYEVMHFPKTSNTLFSDYISTFNKLKKTYSDWPVNCVTDEDKEEYIRCCKEKEKIEIDKDQVCKNPGLRNIAKIMLNSFWGKFAQRDDLTKSKYCYEAHEFYELLMVTRWKC